MWITQTPQIIPEEVNTDDTTHYCIKKDTKTKCSMVSKIRYERTEGQWQKLDNIFVTVDKPTLKTENSFIVKTGN